MDTQWHFPIIIIASIAIFILIIKLVVPQKDFTAKRKQIFLLALIVVVFGMFFGKYGATYGLTWWVYYPIPMLITVLLPSLILKLKVRNTIVYLFLSFLSAPFIHAMFYFVIGWTGYMPFLEIPFVGNL